MITEEQMKTLFVEANPIPDPESIDLDQVGGTAYLATLKQRSSDMRQLDTKRTEDELPRRRTIWMVAAVLALIVGTVAVVLATQDNQETPVVDEPTPTTAAIPSTTEATEPANVSMGTVLMEFDGMTLESTFEDCSLEPLLAEESFRAGRLRLDATGADGSEWQISAMLNLREPGDFQFEAVGPDGQPNLLAWPEKEGTTLDSAITETSAVFNTQFFNRVDDSPADIPVTVTISCG